MIICPFCQKQVQPGKHCSQCGKEFPPSATGSSATLLVTQTQIQSRTSWQQALDLKTLFASRSRIILGRAQDCDHRIPHPSVSRYHAALEQRPDGLYVADVQSTNGVWVDGHRVGPEGRPVREGDRIGIGPVVLLLSGGVLQGMDSSRGLRLEVRSVEKLVPGFDGRPRKLLDNISLVINPGEFVCLLGPSGSGKSTLMDCLNGRRPATGGKVLANGLDFYRHFDSFRQSLGYVPQKDIVHTALTVERALFFTARLRLPPDTAADELQTRIEHVIKLMELDKHRTTLIANLSGGQIKRVSLGAELLAEPALLYIDEATSGLDAGTEARMMRLFRHLTTQGRSLLCITHNVDNVDQAHLVVVLAQGKLIYFGPPGEAAAYFGAKRISEVYDRIALREPEEWQRQFRASEFHRELIEQRLASVSPSTPAVPEPEEPALPATLGALLGETGKKLAGHLPPLAEYFRTLDIRNLRWKNITRPVREANNQFGVLVRRYLELIAGDRRSLWLLVLQVPIVAVFLLVGFLGKPFTSPIPMAREATPAELRALKLCRSFSDLLDSKEQLSKEQRDALSRIKMQVAGMPVKMDGNAVVSLLRQLHSREPSAAEREMLDSATFTAEVDGKTEKVSAAEILDAWRRFHELHIPHQLLDVEGPFIPVGQVTNPRYTYILLFVMVMIVLWFGCNNAAKEIVKEEAIYNRERAVNLGILPYLGSKFLVLGGITILHVLGLMLCVYGPLELAAYLMPGYTVPPPQHMRDYGGQLLVLSLLALTGVALGLLLSACVSSPDRANALLPYVLIPQMILGGGILSVTGGLLYWMAAVLSPVYWGFRAVHLGAAALPKAFPGYDPHTDGMLWPCVMLVAQTAVLMGLTWVFMKQKDV